MKNFLLFSPDGSDTAGGSLKTFTRDQMRKLSNTYKVLVSDPEEVIRIMNFSGQALQKLGAAGDRISFIPGADDNGAATIIIAIFHEDTKLTEYHNYTDYFNSTQSGMEGRPVLCPPPGSCDLS